MKNQNTRRLVESALMIAIGTVLSELKIGSLWAFGGGLTIGSMEQVVALVPFFAPEPEHSSQFSTC